MIIRFSEYHDSRIRFITLSDNGLLLNTIDVCSVLGITDRPADSVLSLPCLDLASAVIVASAQDIDFAMWLNENFASYNSQQLLHPQCDDNWEFAV